MPQFNLDLGTPKGAITFGELDAFTQGYIEAMFFTSASNPDDGELGDCVFTDMATEALNRIVADCMLFQTGNAALLDRAYALGAAQACYDEARAGHDFWYTRNGHGTGFWDRGLGEVGKQLADVTPHSPVDLYRGDDGLIYLWGDHS